MINGTHIVGKGSVGIVVKAKLGSKVRALKIKRTDAGRDSMDNEASLHKLANDAGVGPILQGNTKNLIAMEFVEGENIIDWINDKTAKNEIYAVARAILEQCFRLDMAGIDHGELSRLCRHVIISHKCCIVDFESASSKRKTNNVTSATQAIFLYGILANKVKMIIGYPQEKKIIEALKNYKLSQTRDHFDRLLESLSI
jgi:putative serine/threonine protein kinase